MEDEPNPNRHPGHNYLWPEWWTTMSKNEKKQYKKKKKKNKKKMLHANLEASSTFLRKTKDYEDTVRNATRKLQRPAFPAMPCTTSQPAICAQNAGEDPPSKPGGDPTRFEQQTCLLEAISQTPLNSHPDHIATGEDQSVNDHGQVHNPILIPEAVKILRAKAAGSRSGTSSVICRSGAN